MQVKDGTTKMIMNKYLYLMDGHSSDPSLTPFDHAIYDLQLLNCNTA